MKGIKIFVFAYNRYDTMTTSNLLSAERIPHYVVCHTQDDVKRFKGGKTINEDYASILVSGNPRGLTRQRNFALRFVEDGEWCLFLNDDLNHITLMHDYEKYAVYASYNLNAKNIELWNERLNERVTLTGFLNFCQRAIENAKPSVHLIGFASNSNTMFRSKRVLTKGLVDGRAILVKKSILRFDENVNCIEDHDWSAQNYMHFGCVHIENWCCPEFSRMTKGGFGTINERADELRKEAAYLIAKYPYLFEYKEKRGYPPKTQLKFKKL